MPPGRPGGALTAWPGWLSMSPDVPACMPGAVSSSPRTQENPTPARLRTCRDITRAQAGASAGRPAVLFLLSLRHRAPSPVSAGTSTPALTHRDEQPSRAPAQASLPIISVGTSGVALRYPSADAPVLYDLGWPNCTGSLCELRKLPGRDGLRPYSATCAAAICAPSVFLLGIAETSGHPVVQALRWVVAATR